MSEKLKGLLRSTTFVFFLIFYGVYFSNQGRAVRKRIFKTISGNFNEGGDQGDDLCKNFGFKIEEACSGWTVKPLLLMKQKYFKYFCLYINIRVKILIIVLVISSIYYLQHRTGWRERLGRTKRFFNSHDCKNDDAWEPNGIGHGMPTVEFELFDYVTI